MILILICAIFNLIFQAFLNCECKISGWNKIFLGHWLIQLRTLRKLCWLVRSNISRKPIASLKKAVVRLLNLQWRWWNRFRLVTIIIYRITHGFKVKASALGGKIFGVGGLNSSFHGEWTKDSLHITFYKELRPSLCFGDMRFCSKNNYPAFFKSGFLNHWWTAKAFDWAASKKRRQATGLQLVRYVVLWAGHL